MNIPDYITPFTAYRTWQWDGEGLKSLNGEPWVPGEANVAICTDYRRKFYVTYNTVDTSMTAAIPGYTIPNYTSDKRLMTPAEARLFHADFENHHAPVEECSCGIYAAKDWHHLVKHNYADKGIHGEVHLWGVLLEHTLGYRAQYAYPKFFVIPTDMIPSRVDAAEARLTQLALYNVDVFLTESRFENENSQTRIPIWRKDYGWVEDGQSYLLDLCSAKYGNREDAMIRQGTRVAIKGKGIGTVVKFDYKPEPTIWICLFNRVIYKARRRDVVWHEGNYRWEALHTCGEMPAYAPAKNNRADLDRLQAVMNLPTDEEATKKMRAALGL